MVARRPRWAAPVSIGTLALGTVASAQAPAPPPQPLETFMPNPVAWLKEAHRFVLGNGLPGAVEGLAYALVFALLLYGLLRASYFGRSAEVKALLGRLLLAAAVLLGTPSVRVAAQDGWAAVYGWSSGLWATRLSGDLKVAAGNLGLQFGGLWGLAAAGKWVSAVRAAGPAAKKAVEGGAGAAAEAVAATGGGDRFGLMRTLLNLSSLLLSPLIGVYAALVFLSGLTVLIGLVLLPLSAALLMVPGGETWIGRWVGAYAGALFTAAFLPLVFGIALRLGLIEPVNRMSEELSRTWGELVGIAQGTADARGSLVPGSPFEAARQLVDGEYWRRLGDALAHVVQLLVAVVVGLVSTVIGLVVGAFLLLNLERQVVAFVGGFANAVGGGPRGIGLSRGSGGRGRASASAEVAPASTPGAGATTGQSVTASQGGGAGSGQQGGPPSPPAGGVRQHAPPATQPAGGAPNQPASPAPTPGATRPAVAPAPVAGRTP